MQTLVKGDWWMRQRQPTAWNCHLHPSLRFSGSSNHYDRCIFGTRLTAELVSSKIIPLGYATQRPTFVFESAGFGCQCCPLQRINRITLTAVAPSGEYQSSLHLSLIEKTDV